ncbi:hypothetical protein F5Y16DRAFT_361185 [Xylariaceae sp. FL0255]|nr:hypothetical protein F5Y16DRAFT_361185 [Xylariaceae sp. FL0255]
MSGLDLAGLILGALPLVLQAIRVYRDVFSSIKKAERTLRRLQSDLETEQILLRTSVEKLLVMIVPLNKVADMIQNPFGSEWNSYNDELRLSLWDSSSTFERCIAEMSDAIHELRRKLNIQGDNQVYPKDRVSMITELKKGISFAWKKGDYDGILSRIKNSNMTLQNLIGSQSELEPSRRRRSQNDVTRLFRDISQSIYNALCDAMSCKCAYQHNLGFQLAHRKAVISPSVDREEVAKCFAFYVAFKGMSEIGPEKRQWAGVKLQISENEKTESVLHVTPSQEMASVANTRKVRWALERRSEPSVTSSAPTSTASTSATTTITQTIAQTKSPVIAITNTVNSSHVSVSNLCAVLQRGQTTNTAGCYGYIRDIERKFQLFPALDGADRRGAISLGELISRSSSGDVLFSNIERFKVALDLSASVLHLFKTQWLEQVITLDDIIFLIGDTAVRDDSCPLYRPFVTKRVSEKQSQTSIPAKKDPMQTRVRHVNFTILSLGTLLTQIIVGKVVDELTLNENMDMKSIMSIVTAGGDLEAEILEYGSDTYMDIVRWCLNSTFKLETFENMKFCQEFYEAVIVRLEDAVKILESKDLL